MVMKRIDLRIIGALWHMAQPLGGFDIIKAARTNAARVYPALERLEEAGYVKHFVADTGRTMYYLDDGSK